MPQPCARSRERETLKSSSPARMKASTSFRRCAGSMRSRPLSISSSSGCGSARGERTSCAQRPAPVTGGAPSTARRRARSLREALAAGAVQALVVTLRRDPPVERRPARGAQRPAVARVAARAEKVVVRELERLAKRGKPVGLRRYELRDRQASYGRSLDVLQRVIVSPLRKRTCSPRSRRWRARTSTCTHSSANPEMRVPVDVRDRRGDVEAALAHGCFPLWPSGQHPMSAPTPRSLGPVSTVRSNRAE